MGRVIQSIAAAAATVVLLAGMRAAGQESRTAAGAAQPVSPLFAQSAGRMLDRQFPSPDISYLLLDAQTGATLAARWPEAELPVPLGSLVKPFTALAYARSHGYLYPAYVCHGKAGGCWQPRAHGRLNIVSALAFSCNSYFRNLSSRLSAAEMREVAAQFGLDPPGPGVAGAALMGLGDQWPIAPLRMAHAYLELARRGDEPGVREILAGLADSAQWGTGSAVGRAVPRLSVLAKTGTAECHHSPRAPGDGFVIAMVPAEQPQLLLMVSVHGSPGSRAAQTAGDMLCLLEQ